MLFHSPFSEAPRCRNRSGIFSARSHEAAGTARQTSQTSRRVFFIRCLTQLFIGRQRSETFHPIELRGASTAPSRAPQFVHRLHPAADVQLFVNLVEVPANRAERNGQLLGDLLAGVTVGHELENLPLA